MTSQIASLPGDPHHPNEDVALVQDRVLVLLDGATAPQGVDTGCCHGVAWYAHQLTHSILSHARVRQTSLTDALASAITDTNAMHQHTCDLSNPESPSSTVVIARLTDREVESLVLADSSFIVHRHNDQPVVVTDHRLQQLKAASQVTATLSTMRNQPGGFWVAQTDPQVASNALLNRWPLAGLSGVTALTDGATRPVDVFQTRTWTTYAAELATIDPFSILADIRSTEDSDPDRLRWPRTKSHDDATIARIIFSANPLGPTAESAST